MTRARWFVPILAATLGSGCMYRVGSHLTSGMLDEAIGEDRTGGIEVLGDRILERQLAAEIGHQLGSGLTSGATEITPEQQKALEDAIDGLLAVAALRSGDGIRKEVSPAVRQMVRDDIIRTLADGMRGEVGDSLEDTTDRVVTRAIQSLRRGIEDDDTRLALSELLRDSVYMAMREGNGVTPGVGETLQTTLTENVLDPFEHSVNGIADTVAIKVEEQARRTENTLRAIIAALAVVLGVFMIMYLFSRRQLVKAQTTVLEKDQDLRHMGAAIGLLDDDTRERVVGKLDAFRGEAKGPRSESYERKDRAPDNKDSGYERKDPK